MDGIFSKAYVNKRPIPYIDIKAIQKLTGNTCQFRYGFGTFPTAVMVLFHQVSTASDRQNICYTNLPGTEKWKLKDPLQNRSAIPIMDPVEMEPMTPA